VPLAITLSLALPLSFVLDLAVDSQAASSDEVAVNLHLLVLWVVEVLEEVPSPFPSRLPLRDCLVDVRRDGPAVECSGDAESRKKNEDLTSPPLDFFAGGGWSSSES
jgi:hypothetical protein